MYNCIDCGEQPEYICTAKSGHAIFCSKCDKMVSGYKREEYAIEEWNFWNDVSAN